MDKAVRSELAAAGKAGPTRTLLAAIRTWVRQNDLLRDWQPAPNGDYRSGKAELDLTWCLGRIWCLHAGGAEPSPERLEELFRAEVEQRAPALGDDGAFCQGQQAGAEEVYPSLLGLLTPKRREQLLREAVE